MVIDVPMEPDAFLCLQVDPIDVINRHMGPLDTDLFDVQPHADPRSVTNNTTTQ